MKMEFYRFCIIFAAAITTGYAKASSHGWNDGIDWLSLQEARAMSQETGRPIMLLIHKSWCGACKALKEKFKESKEIEELSKYFLMVNLMDDEEPENDMYSPDGKYIPRILFINKGEIIEDLIHEEGNKKYKYYYHSPIGIVKTMERAIKSMDLKDAATLDREDL